MLNLRPNFTSNYYEYEIPVHFTEWGVNSSMANAQNRIWPTLNNMEVNLELLTQIKQQRNILMRKGDPDVALITPFVAYDGEAKITVILCCNWAYVHWVVWKIGFVLHKKVKFYIPPCFTNRTLGSAEG